MTAKREYILNFNRSTELYFPWQGGYFYRRCYLRGKWTPFMKMETVKVTNWQGLNLMFAKYIRFHPFKPSITQMAMEYSRRREVLAKRIEEVMKRKRGSEEPRLAEMEGSEG